MPFWPKKEACPPSREFQPVGPVPALFLPALSLLGQNWVGGGGHQEQAKGQSLGTSA